MRQTGGKVPVEILVGVIECIITIARNQALRDTIITGDIIDAICASFEVYICFNIYLIFIIFIRMS